MAAAPQFLHGSRDHPQRGRGRDGYLQHLRLLCRHDLGCPLRGAEGGDPGFGQQRLEPRALAPPAPLHQGHGAGLADHQRGVPASSIVRRQGRRPSRPNRTPPPLLHPHRLPAPGPCPLHIRVVRRGGVDHREHSLRAALRPLPQPLLVLRVSLRDGQDSWDAAECVQGHHHAESAAHPDPPPRDLRVVSLRAGGLRLLPESNDQQAVGAVLLPLHVLRPGHRVGLAHL
mmetsp:Transcript_51844/g.118240  ORF Transcript_51844/g.118240 Transcript_51844/m.118240 type:complete len:229 (+) Transcript_51844:241-927(+)